MKVVPPQNLLSTAPPFITGIRCLDLSQKLVVTSTDYFQGCRHLRMYSIATCTVIIRKRKREHRQHWTLCAITGQKSHPRWVFCHLPPLQRGASTTTSFPVIVRLSRDIIWLFKSINFKAFRRLLMYIIAS